MAADAGVRRVGGALVLEGATAKSERVVVWGRPATRRMIGLIVADPQCHCRGRACRWHALPAREIGNYRAVRAEWEPEQHVPWAEIAAGRKLLRSPDIALHALLGTGYHSVRDAVAALVDDARSGRKVPVHQALDVEAWRPYVERWEQRRRWLHRPPEEH